MSIRILLIAATLSTYFQVSGQLKAGFDKNEYKDLLSVFSQFVDPQETLPLPKTGNFKRVYRSPVLGLDNVWELWNGPGGIPIISIRGTTQKQISWMENFYAAMVPATGEIQLSNDFRFPYRLAESPRAAVHVGWLIGMAFLSRDMLPKIDSLYKTGIRNCYIVGHSQGGAIAFLLTAYLHFLQSAKQWAPNLQFKTYCSAAPKPGNLYFAYDYEAFTQNGWAFNVVNAADWVPQSPFSVQTVEDFTNVNPFSNVDPFLKSMSLIKKIAVRHVYSRLSKPSEKAEKNFSKYLGRYVSRAIKKALPGFIPPSYFNSSDYVRTGTTISLVPHDDYYRVFPEDKAHLFRNHTPKAYLYLADRLP